MREANLKIRSIDTQAQVLRAFRGSDERPVLHRKTSLHLLVELVGYLYSVAVLRGSSMFYCHTCHRGSHWNHLETAGRKQNGMTSYRSHQNGAECTGKIQNKGNTGHR